MIWDLTILSCELQVSILYHRVNATFFVSEILPCLFRVSFHEIDFLFKISQPKIKIKFLSKMLLVILEMRNHLLSSLSSIRLRKPVKIEKKSMEFSILGLNPPSPMKSMAKLKKYIISLQLWTNLVISNKFYKKDEKFHTFFSILTDSLNILAIIQLFRIIDIWIIPFPLQS